MSFKKFIPILIAMLMLVSIGAAAAADVNTSQIGKSASSVKSYVESNGKLPSSVTVGNQTGTPSQFLYLLTKSTVNINSGSTSKIAIKSVAKPTSPSETVKSGTLTKSQYVSYASKINTFITNNGRLPNYASTNLGNMRYENLVYTYSKILAYYNTNKKLPSTVSVKTWSTIAKSTSTTSSGSVSRTDIITSAKKVKSYVETNGALPSTVTVGSKTVTSSQFLYLLAKGTGNINSGSTSKIAIKSVAKPTSPKDSMKSGTLTKSQYVSYASKVVSYITSNGKSPNYVSTALGNMRYENLVYTYSKILAYYNTNKKLPSTVSVKSWTLVTYGSPATINITKPKTQTLLGENSLGYVLKLGPFGTGKNKIAMIIGVHPEEQQTHVAMLNAIGYLTSTLKNVQIWVYDVVVTKDVLDYSASRMNGQLLAKKYVVPNIGTSYKLVMDVHGNRGNYYDKNGKLVKNSIFAPSNGATSKSYANKIIAKSNGNLVYLNIESGTSPTYVTIPIAKKGIPAVLYEQYINQAHYAKTLFANAIQVVKAINSIFA